MTAQQTKPRLENGDVMTREEFHRLYSDCPGMERVELIEGVVYTPSPIRYEGHARQQGLIIEWLAAYAAGHPGVRWSPPGSVLLDDDNEPEPDAMLFRVSSERFEDGYLLGAPELVVEIAASSKSRDLHQKKRAYERNGVIEYIVWRTDDAAIDWFTLRDGAYSERKPDDAGVIESGEFPGLRLHLAAALALDRDAVLGALAE
jgi:Uma2 family endonuclease